MKKIAYGLILFLFLFLFSVNVEAATVVPNNGGFKCVYSVPYKSNSNQTSEDQSFEVILEREDEDTKVENNARIKITVVNNLDSDDCGGSCKYYSPANDYNAGLALLNYGKITIDGFVNSRAQWECPDSIQSVVGIEQYNGNSGVWSIILGMTSFTTEIDKKAVASIDAKLVERKSEVNNQKADEKINISVCSYTLVGFDATFVGTSYGNSIYEFSTDAIAFNAKAVKDFTNSSSNLSCPLAHNLSFCLNNSNWYIISKGDTCDSGYTKYDFTEAEEDVKDEDPDSGYNPGNSSDDDDNDNKYTSSSSTIQLKEGCSVLSSDLKNWLIQLLDIIKVGGLILSLILSMFDFFKGVTSGEADAMKKVWKSFFNRLIAVVLLFLLPLIIEFILGLISINGVDASNPLCGIK